MPSHKNFRPLSVVLALALIAALALSACGGDDDKDKTSAEPTAEKSGYTIGLSLAEYNTFFTILRDSAQTAADLQDVTLLAANAENSADTQAETIQGWIDQGVDLLLINPVEADAIVSSIEAANEAGIPVFTIDRTASGGEVASHIASDNVAGGKMAGEFLAEAIGKSGNVVELQGILTTSAAQDRGKGFNEAMATYPDITIIAQEPAGFNREEGKSVFAQILADNPEIDAVFAHNDEMILGALEAAQEAGRASDIVFVGFDAVDDAIDAVEAGDMAATVAQQPAEMGRIGIESAVDYLDGKEVPASIPVDLSIITQ
ncbi:MAG TPA: substrate-binding domain-containing protein [Aggregatilinea sp.]|uniref:substrate-binding domain-containing protein n=1 Tax=Aggregatilinea sp. TaxID=2806333 RepID=UPI002C10762C|nr:substrate-binding domain-containing protein [Aggregatilinea sp.]HML22318.1 substrate-binding domain-containing protein [Aggregatilinea sp.]